MLLLIKLTISLLIILTCTFLAKKFPSLAGLIAVMPLTGVIVLFWLRTENRNDETMLAEYTKGAILGIFPTILFYISAYICFLKKVPLGLTILISFGVWLTGALLHHQFFK